LGRGKQKFWKKMKLKLSSESVATARWIWGRPMADLFIRCDNTLTAARIRRESQRWHFKQLYIHIK
jgi:hypothetical protein